MGHQATQPAANPSVLPRLRHLSAAPALVCATKILDLFPIDEIELPKVLETDAEDLGVG